MQNQHRTSDFGEVTLAVYHGYEITDVDNSQRRATFTLAVDDRWPAILARYEQGRERVEPKRWGECQRAVKACLYDGDLSRARREAGLSRAMGGEVER
ncbi:MAG: hypothetical protein FJ026_13645 [Chloroflexi bacterium]|nr:hypothetical protein [Chloroflexota bacterium]